MSENHDPNPIPSDDDRCLFTAPKRTTTHRKAAAVASSSSMSFQGLSGSRHAASSGTTRPPTILSPCRARYQSLLACKVRKVERQFSFDDIEDYHLEELFTTNGMDGWVNIWQSTYCDELVLSFLAHLSFNKESAMFTTTVQGTHIQFTIPQLCDELQLPTSGIDPYDSYTENGFTRDEALKVVLDKRYDEERKKKLYRPQLPHLQQLLSYVLHFNIMPRGGKANDEVPNHHLQFLYGVLVGRPIDFCTILFEVFTKLADKNVKIICYHKLITKICLNQGVRIGDWNVYPGETINKKKLTAMRLPARPTDDSHHPDQQMVGSDDSDSNDDGTEPPLRQSSRLRDRPSSRVDPMDTEGADDPTDEDDFSWSDPIGPFEVPPAGPFDMSSFQTCLGYMFNKFKTELCMSMSEELALASYDAKHHYIEARKTLEDVRTTVYRIENKVNEQYKEYRAWQQEVESRVDRLEQGASPSSPS